MKALLMGLEVLTVHVKRLCRRSSSEARVYAPICSFCKGKFQRGSKSHEKLTQTVQLRAFQTLCNCAIRKTLTSSAHWTALPMGFLTYSWRRTTLLCLQKLATSLKQKFVLSASIKPYVFINLAWDILDRLEETLTERWKNKKDS